MDNLYNTWMNNAKSGVKNSSILLLCLEDKLMIKTMENEIERLSNVTLLALRKITKEILNQGNNLIVYFVKEFSLGHLQVFSNGNGENIQILFIRMLYNNSNNSLMYQDFSFPRFHQGKIVIQVLPFMYNRDSISAISLEGITFLKQFIANFITNHNDSCAASKKSIKTFLYRNMKNISNETILKDIEFLQYRGLLTSRLAIIIYKICTFNFNASDKTVGLYFFKYYGRSKVLNDKNFGVVNVKGYIVKDINFQEQRIRSDIANNLYMLGVNTDIITQATGVQLSNHIPHS